MLILALTIDPTLPNEFMDVLDN